MKVRTAAHWTVVVSALTTFACATTYQSTWKSPDARPLHLAGRKVAAVFVNRDPTLRRRAEDAMAREISARGAQGVPAYTVLSESEARDRDPARARFGQLGFSGAVVMRIVGSETHYTYEPAFWAGPNYHQFWGGYWDWGWGTVWEPAYLRTDRIVKVETLVYSLEQDQLVWSGVSRTLNPSEIEGFVPELAAAASKQMASERLFSPELSARAIAARPAPRASTTRAVTIAPRTE
jgi:hypothetical protein